MEKKIVFIETIIIIGIASFGIAPFGWLFAGDINLIDEGQFAAWVNEMLAGKLMYKDLYITYGPLYVYPLFILSKIFGLSAFLVRLYLILGGVLGIVVVNLIAFKLGIMRGIRYLLVVILILLPVMTLRQGLGFISIYFIAIAFESNKSKWFVIAGILSSISILTSPEIGAFIFLIFSIFGTYLFVFRKKVVKLIKNLFVYILTYGVVLAGFSLWASSNGWFGDYLRVTQDVLTSFSGVDLPNGQRFPLPGYLISEFGVFGFLRSYEILLYFVLGAYIVVAIVLTIAVLFFKDKQVLKIIIAIALFGVMMYSIVIGRSGIGHFFFVISPLLLIFAYGSHWLIRKFRKTKEVTSRIVAMAVLVVIFLFVLRLMWIYRPNIESRISFDYSTKSNVSGIYLSKDQERYIMEIKNFVEENTSKKDYIYFLSNEPMMYLLVDRPNPTKYVLPFIANKKDKRLEVLNDLQTKAPKFIFFDENSWPVDGISNIVRLPEVIMFVKRNYEESGLLNDRVRVFKIKK